MSPYIHDARKSAGIAVVISVVALVVAVGALLLSLWRDNGVDYVFKDIAYLCGHVELGVLAGVISAMGVLLWSGSAGMALLAASVLIARPSRSSKVEGRAMLALGALTLALTIDDQLLIHENLPALGIPQWVYPVVYALSILTILVVFRTTLLEHRFLILLISLGMFGLSTLLDVLADSFEIGGRYETVYEDTAKFIGIALWTTFIALNARFRIERQA